MGKPLTPGSLIGFVGLGNMGHPMAMRLAAAGYRLHLVDARPLVAQEMAAETGGVALASVAELGAGVDAVILMLPDGKTVQKVVVEQGLASRMPHGSLLIDMGSCEPGGTAILGLNLEATGIDMVDAPVSGGVPRARTGELTIMVGGKALAVERARPMLSVLGNKIYATGRLGSGQAMKSLNNFVSAVGLVATCEAVNVGRHFGLQPEVIAEVLNGSTGKNNTTEHKLKQFILSESFGSGFSLDLMVKDLGIAAGVARDADVHSVFMDECLRMWKAAQQLLGPGRDHTEMARWVNSVMQTNQGDKP